MSLLRVLVFMGVLLLQTSVLFIILIPLRGLEVATVLTY